MLRIAVFSLLLFLLFPLSVFAQSNFQSNNQVVLRPGEVINRDYFAAGEKVDLAGTVNGDVFLAGGDLTIEGVVNGDLLVVGGKVNILGKVLGNVRTVGGNIFVSGEIGRNLTSASGSLTVSDSARLGGSLVATGGSLDVFASVPKDATLAGGTITVANSVNGDLTAATGNLTLNPNSKVKGNLTYWSDSEAQINSGASISGKLIHNYPPTQFDKRKSGEKLKSGLNSLVYGFKVVTLIATLLLGLLIIKLTPNFTKETVGVVKERPWASLGIGFLSFILIPVIFVVLLISVIGIPIAFLFLGLFFLILFVSKIYVILWLGLKSLQLIGNEKTSQLWAFAIGILIYAILTWIPIIGGIASMFLTSVGVGALLIQKRRFYSLIKSKNLI